MTDPDRLTADTETQEALMPEYAHLQRMQLLADTIVWKFGTPDAETSSRTLTWRGDGRTYYLGRGGWWEPITGQPATDENWLMVMPDMSEEGEDRLTPEFVLQRISSENTALAINHQLREEVAAMLHAGLAGELVSWAARIFPPTEEGKPGKGSMLYDSMSHNLIVFGDAAHPFMFVDVAGVRYDLGHDSPLERVDATQRPRDGKYIKGGPEERLLHLLRVMDEGVRQEPKPAFSFYDGHREPVIVMDLPENLDHDQRWVVSGAMGTIIEWWEGNPPDALDLWEDSSDEYGLRTLVPGVWNGQDAAVGMVVTPDVWTVEVIPLTGDKRHDTISIDLLANTAHCNQNAGPALLSHKVGGAAFEYAKKVLEDLDRAMKDGTLQECPRDIRRRFQHPVIKAPEPTGDTVE